WVDTGNTSERFFNGDSVTLGDGPTNRNLTLGVTIFPAAMTVNNSSGNDYSISGAGSIAGSGGLTKSGTGTLTLATNNTYSGPTSIGAGGTLQVGNGGGSGSLGTGAVTNDGTLIFNRTGTTTVNGAIGGAGSLQQNGTGTTILASNSSYAG